MKTEELDQLEISLGNWYHNTFRNFFGNREFKLAKDYRTFMLRFEPDWKNGRRHFGWYNTAKMIGHNTRYVTRLWAPSLTEKHDMWICFASWSDKHDLWLNCSSDSPHFGRVVDCHDSHPWADSHIMPYGKTFTVFLGIWKESFKK